MSYLSFNDLKAEYDYPLVSIGVPIYNAGHELERVLQALLAQDYPNFEIIISDNASTDQTWDICTTYAAQDSRIQIHRSDANKGALTNFENVFSLASGKYFLWAAHDDSWKPSYIRVCVEALEQNPASVLCYTDQVIHDKDRDTEKVVSYQLDGLNPLFWKRACSFLLHKPTPYGILYGVYRRQAIEPCLPFPRTVIFDAEFLLTVLQQGIVLRVPQVLFTKQRADKPFHPRWRSVIPEYKQRPQSWVLTGLLFHLLKFSLKNGDGIIGKLQLSLAVTRFVGQKIIVQTFPVSLRRRLRPYFGLSQ